MAGTIDYLDYFKFCDYRVAKRATRQEAEIMRKKYDLTTLKLKRRGILPGLQGQSPAAAKVKIMVTLDEDIVDYFQSQVDKSEVLSLQALVNQTLRQIIQPAKSRFPVGMDQ